ncbi:MAG TPA: hypothetical protein VJZ00_12085 [Thermoanaerobaculia bacterium]|nr:hypothetical protein [Thermoanaerobaculia bacterium]
MKNFVFAAAFLLLGLSAMAQESTLPRDAHTDMLARDLHAIGRVASVAENVDRERQVLLAIVDSDIKDLRGPRDDGTYQWASLQREEGGRVKDEKTIEQVYTEKELRRVTVSGANGYRVEVYVPKKRGTFSANNRVWVGTVHAEITDFDGKVSTHDVVVNNWVNPGDSEGGPLPLIGKSVKATVELGVESGSKQAVAEVSLVQAKLTDDPNSPYFPAVKRLLAIREIIAAKDINRGQLKNATDEALLALPGELEKRVADQAEAARVRKMMAEAGTMTGSIHVGDATPDVIAEMAEIARLLAGTVQEQTDGRARLDTLIASLKAKPE